MTTKLFKTFFVHFKCSCCFAKDLGKFSFYLFFSLFSYKGAALNKVFACNKPCGGKLCQKSGCGFNYWCGFKYNIYGTDNLIKSSVFNSLFFPAELFHREPTVLDSHLHGTANESYGECQERNKHLTYQIKTMEN